MRHRLAQRKGGLVQVERALEQHGQHVVGAHGLLARGLHHLGQPVAVVVVQLLDARVQAGEGLAVRGQHQRVGRQRREAVDGVEEQRQRIGLGLHLVHAHVGRDARQHHVAADQDAGRLAVQRHVLGRVAVAGDAAPHLAANGDGLAIEQACVAGRHRGHQAAVVALAVADLLQIARIRHAVAVKVVGQPLAAKAVDDLAGVARGHVVGAAHPQRGGPLLAQPVRQAHVVGVHVGDQHAQDGQAVQLVGKHLRPGGARFGVVDAGVDHRPAVAAVDAVAQQPEVDVIQRKGQHHAQPLDARRHADGAALRRQLVGQGVVQGTFEFGGNGHGCLKDGR